MIGKKLKKDKNLKTCKSLKLHKEIQQKAWFSQSA